MNVVDDLSVVVLDHHDAGVAQQILVVTLAAYAVEAALIACDDFPPLRTTRSQVQNSEGQFLGVYQASELLGAVQIEQLSNHTAVHRLVVSPKSFRQGVGKLLISAVQKQATQLSLSTAALNQPAISLYKKQGFAVVKRWLDETTGIELVEMRWHQPKGDLAAAK